MQISIVIPVFNSEEILERLTKTINDELKIKLNETGFEVLFINDFSSDRSWEKIKKLSLNYKFVKGINLAKNFGQHNAIMAGFNYCSGDYVITMDDDLQHHPKFILNIFEALKDCDACYTYY